MGMLELRFSRAGVLRMRALLQGQDLVVKAFGYVPPPRGIHESLVALVNRKWNRDASTDNKWRSCAYQRFNSGLNVVQVENRHV